MRSILTTLAHEDRSKNGPAGLVSLAALVLGVGVGSVWIPPGQVVGALASSLFGLPLPQEIDR